MCFGVECAKQYLPTCFLFCVLTGIRIVTQSTRLPKVTITLTVTMTMTSSLSTAIHGGHQRDGCFLPHLKVSYPLPAVTHAEKYSKSCCVRFKPCRIHTLLESGKSRFETCFLSGMHTASPIHRVAVSKLETFHGS